MDILGIIGNVKCIRQKFSSPFERRKRAGEQKVAESWVLSFREGESSFSLDFSPFRPLVRFGPRSKVVLRGKGYACAQVLWSSDNSKR